MQLEDIDIKIYQAKKEGNVIAYATLRIPLIINEEKISLKITGFRIMPRRNLAKTRLSYMVCPPSMKGRGKYHDVFYLENKELWFKLEEYMVEEYTKILKLKTFNQED